MSKRVLVGGAAVCAAVVCAVLFADPAHAVSVAADELRGASPIWLIAAGSAFLAAVLASAAAWHRALAASGARLGRVQVAQRYTAGCLANTLAPANAGEVVRVALLSRAIETEGAAFTVIGVSAVVAVVRITVVAALFGVTASGSSVLWFAGAALGVVALAAVAYAVFRGRCFTGRAKHLLDVVRGLAATPAAALEIVAWVAAGTCATILASACVGAALGVPHPLAAALVIVPAIELARLLPLTPGNVGLTSAAVALTLHARGVPMDAAAAAGIALHGVETIVGVAVGAAGALSLTPRLELVARIRVLLRPSVGRIAAAAAASAVVLGAVTSVIGARGGLG